MPIKIEFKEVKFEDLKVGDYVEVFSGERHSDYCVGFITEFIEEPDGTHYIAIGDNLHFVEPRDSYKRATPVIDEKELKERIYNSWRDSAEEVYDDDDNSIGDYVCEANFKSALLEFAKELIGG